MLTADKMKIFLNELLTSNDCRFLRSLYVAALPDQDTLDFTKKKRAEIHRFGFILKLIDGENAPVKCIREQKSYLARSDSSKTCG